MPSGELRTVTICADLTCIWIHSTNEGKATCRSAKNEHEAATLALNAPEYHLLCSHLGSFAGRLDLLPGSRLVNCGRSWVHLLSAALEREQNFRAADYVRKRQESEMLSW